MSIADIFLTPRQQKILAPLLLHPESSLRLSELLVLSGSGRGASQKHIQKFVDVGLLVEERRGNQRCLKINENFPLYSELRSISMKSFGLKEELKTVLEPIQNQITECFIFGSVASGKDSGDSDIDLMVIGTVDLIKLMDLIAPLENRIARKIDVNLHAPEEWKSLQETDQVIKQIKELPMIRILPDAKTS